MPVLKTVATLESVRWLNSSTLRHFVGRTVTVISISLISRRLWYPIHRWHHQVMHVVT